MFQSTAAGYIHLAKQASSYKTLTIELELREDTAYKVGCRTFVIEIKSNSSNVLEFDLVAGASEFIIRADITALANLSETIKNLAQSVVGTHFFI